MLSINDAPLWSQGYRDVIIQFPHSAVSYRFGLWWRATDSLLPCDSSRQNTIQLVVLGKGESWYQTGALSAGTLNWFGESLLLMWSSSSRKCSVCISECSSESGCRERSVNREAFIKEIKSGPRCSRYFPRIPYTCKHIIVRELTSIRYKWDNERIFSPVED